MAQRTCDVDGCERKHVARGLCPMHWKREYGKRTKYPITCVTCGREHQSERQNGRFCSDECKGFAYQTERRTRSRELVGPIAWAICWLPERHPAMQSPTRTRTWYAGACAWCSENFVSNQPGARYCSQACGKAALHSRRGRFVIPSNRRRAIYERDGWICQLCLEPVDQTLHPSHAWAATLDHIECQAWSDEPDHSDDNLRLAHRWCNSVRGDEMTYSIADLRISPAA